MKTLEIATTRGTFEVLDGGGEDEGRGTPVVLVHGFPFSATAWSDDARALAPDVRVLAPSMRGFGGTSAWADNVPSVDAMADDVVAVLDAMGLRGSVVVGGLSMGGYVALGVARRHPTRVRALVLADTRAEPDSDEAKQGRERGIAAVESGGLDGFVDGLLEKIVGASTRASRPDVVARLRAMMVASRPLSVANALRALRDRPDARPGLADIAVPTLVVVGEEDALTPPDVARALAAGIRSATMSVVPRAGHMANLEQPEAFRVAIADFVRAL